MKKIKLEIKEGKLNIELQAGDKILVENLYGRKKGYIFKSLSPHNEFRLLEAKTQHEVVVGIKWFTYEKNSYLWEEEKNGQTTNI